MQRYETYKDSGVQWLGEIPGHWEVKPIRSILTESEEKSESGQEELLSLSQYTGVSYKKDAGKTGMFEAESTIGYKKVHPGQFVMNIMLAWNGSYAVSALEGIISPAYCVFDFKANDDKMYFHYLWRTGIYQGAFKTESRGIIESRLRLYPNKFLPFPTIYPPLNEQHVIVSYLDDKCGKIDEWIEKKLKEVELLGEMKQRVIADAVTRGLNPNVKMKATNIPWLPEVPEHWEIKPIRAILKESEEKSETGQEELLSLSQYTGVSYKKDVGKVGMFEAESTIGYKKVHPGQFVMNIMLAWNGSYAVSNLDGIISPAYCVFDFISDDDTMYYHYLWRTSAYQGAFKTESRGIIDSRLRLYPNKFLPFPTICPPLSEQRAIVAYITERTAKIDKMVDNVNREIENLKEYKQRLISDVVTGQIKVC